MKKWLLKNKDYILKILSFSIVYFVIFNQYIDNTKINSQKKIVFFIIITAIIMFGYIFITIFTRRKTKLYQKFFIQALVYGIIFLVFIPAILGTDELPHFLRPYQISTGDVIVKHPEKNETQIPKDLYNFIGTHDMKEKYKKDNIIKSVNYNENTNLWNGDVTSINYSPISYIPQILGFKVSKYIKLSPLFTMYLVRLFNFASWLILVTIAIKNIPSRKLSNIILFTSPAVLSLVSTSSGDTFATANIILFISLIFKYKKEKKLLNKKELMVLSLIMLCFCSFKLVYILFILMLFLLPENCFKTKKMKYTYIILNILFMFSIDMLWYKISSVASGTVNEQIQYVLEHPIKYIYIMLNTFFNNIYYYFTNLFAGSEMCYSLVRINEIGVICYALIYIYSLSKEKNNIELDLMQKTLIFLGSSLLIVFVFSAMYISWTYTSSGVGTKMIMGTQSRYFITLVPVLTMLINGDGRKINEQRILEISSFINMILIIDTMKSLITTVI